MRESTCCETVEGDGPVLRAMSARELERPDRTRSRMPPGVPCPGWAGAASLALGPVVLTTAASPRMAEDGCASAALKNTVPTSFDFVLTNFDIAINGRHLVRSSKPARRRCEEPPMTAVDARPMVSLRAVDKHFG